MNNRSWILKSEIYKEYPYAFKFVNRIHVPYPIYFPEFPFGTIEQDMGDYVNDFIFADDVDDEWAQRMGTDWGAARAFRLSYSSEDKQRRKCVALSHETGLEIFLMAAGAFVGMEVAKFTLKRTLETIEGSINSWWKKSRSSQSVHLATLPDEDIPETLVDHIAIRTPKWELKLDGNFTDEQRDKIFEQLSLIVNPPEMAQEIAIRIGDEELAKKQ